MHEMHEVHEIRRIGVLGAGTMGRGIAQVAAHSGFDVILHDLSEELLGAARSAIEAQVAGSVAQSRLTGEQENGIRDRLRYSTSLEDAAREADLVIEAVPEALELKRAVFTQLERVCSPGAVLATNTSSLSISLIAEATARPERVIGLHFFNPVDRMKLLEIVLGRATSERTLAAARSVAERMGKTAIVVKDSPGFATSRLGIALALEAIRMLEEGVAEAADIDAAMELGYRHPMGPLRLTDLVGLDVRLAIAEHLHRSLGRETFRPPELLRRLVREGKMGRKTNEGFYRYEA